MWWELVVQDHMALNVGRPTIIAPTSFTTALMRNYTDEDLETGRWDLAPRPDSEPTTSQLHQGKAATAIFVRRAFDEGPVPDDPTKIEAHFNRLYTLEQEHLSATGTMVDKGSVLFGLPEGAMGKKINCELTLLYRTARWAISQSALTSRSILAYRANLFRHLRPVDAALPAVARVHGPWLRRLAICIRHERLRGVRTDCAGLAQEAGRTKGADRYGLVHHPA
jgi:hypothetical protein